MERNNTKLFLIALMITLAASGLAFGQDSVVLSVAPSALRSLETRGIETGGIAEGQKLKIEGIVINQNDESLTVRDAQASETVVTVTKKTAIKKKRKGWFYGPRSSGADEIRCGVRLKVEGRGNRDGQLVAKNITIEEADPKTAENNQLRITETERRLGQAIQNAATRWTFQTVEHFGNAVLSAAKIASPPAVEREADATKTKFALGL